MKSKNGRLIHLPLGSIRPSRYQPRAVFDESELVGLSESIRRNGLLQPISVRRREDGCYELIAGERRLRAARIAGLSKVPCIELDTDDKRAATLGLIENMQREDLNAFEEAEAIRRLMDEWGVPKFEVAQRLGKAQSTIANKLRLLRLTESQRQRIIAARLTERHARALLRIEDEAERDDALNEIIARQLPIIEAEKYIDDLVAPKSKDSLTPEVFRAMRIPVVRDLRIYLNTLTKAVDTIRRSGLDARSAETETEDYIEYTVYIPKR